MDLRRLFDQHHDELHRYLVRLTGDPDLAGDLAQETFVRWVEREPDDRSPRAWLFTVATNLARDHVRVAARRLALLRESVDRVPVGDDPATPADALEASERRAAVRRALDALPERDRVMLLMRHEGFSYLEIAEAVGTTAQSVGTLLARALKRFSSEIAPILEALR